MGPIMWFILLLAGLILGWFLRWLWARFQLSSSEQKSDRIIQEALRNAEVQKKEILLETKDQLLREKNQLERETRERRNELQRLERRVLYKEESLEKRLVSLEKQENTLSSRDKALSEKEELLLKELERWKQELEKISGLTAEEAKEILIKSIEKEAKDDARLVINKIEEEAKETATEKAREILLTTIGRIATDVSSQVTVTTVSLPNDEMKGRIIGREGRNIRTLETLTGVDIIIDDTPEAVVISCFDPVRKEIARQSMERLITDGRIHPARIEEVVQKVEEDIKQTIVEEGEKALFDLGIHNMSPEGIRALGRLLFRTSHGQNVLARSVEHATLSGLIAAEIGADVEVAKRAALLSEIGKGIETTTEKNYIEAGMELARKIGETQKIINAIGASDELSEPKSIEAAVVQAAKKIVDARPGAKKEGLDVFIKRLENMEKIAKTYPGVEKVYAIQAGREIRVFLNQDKSSDENTKELAKQIAMRIERELQYTGRIKVTLVRETRIVEYAR